jgi:hypothetical protein
MQRLQEICPRGIIPSVPEDVSSDPADHALDQLISLSNPIISTDWDLTMMPWL